MNPCSSVRSKQVECFYSILVFFPFIFSHLLTFLPEKYKKAVVAENSKQHFSIPNWPCSALNVRFDVMQQLNELCCFSSFCCCSTSHSSIVHVSLSECITLCFLSIKKSFLVFSLVCTLFVCVQCWRKCTFNLLDLKEWLFKVYMQELLLQLVKYSKQRLFQLKTLFFCNEAKRIHVNFE